MKKFLLISILFSVIVYSNAQNYSYHQTTGTEFPYTFWDPNDNTLITSGSNVLSSWQTLPFTFTFYGIDYTGYYASDNGYITFDNTATTSISTNDNPPSTSEPNNAIYAFWDGLEMIIGGGAVKSWTYGDAPHRIHVIHWGSPSPEGATSSDIRAGFTIRLYECGDFDIVHEYRGDPGFAATVGCENESGTMGSSITGSPNLDFPDLIPGIDGGVDDIVYHFSYNGQPAFDLQVEKVYNEKIITANDSLKGTIRNLGSTAITSFGLSYSVDNNAPITQNISNVTIAADVGTYAFAEAINLNSPGSVHTIKVWTSDLNGSATDEKQCDDTLSINLVEIENISAVKTVLFEEFTTAPCGYCPEGDYYIDTIQANHPDIVAVAHHAGYQTDAMTTLASSTYADAFATGAPSGTIDRIYSPPRFSVTRGRGEWSSVIVEELKEWTPCDVSLNVTYDSVSRQLDVVLNTDFTDYAIPGDLKTCLWVVEDNVVGTGSGYDQSNFYNDVVGHYFYQQGNPIIGYNHRHVHRDVLGDTWGEGGVIANAPQKGDSYSQAYTTTLSSAWDEYEISVVGFVSYWDSDVRKRPVLNAAEVKLSDLGTLSLNKNTIENWKPAIYPNPASNTACVEFAVNITKPIHLEITDLFGKVIRLQDVKKRKKGIHRVYIDTENLSEGIYFVTLHSEEHKSTMKLSIVR